FLPRKRFAAFVEAENLQLDEIQIGIKELDEGRGVPHKAAANWLGSSGRKRERRAPRVRPLSGRREPSASGPSPRVLSRVTIPTPLNRIGCSKLPSRSPARQIRGRPG